MFCYTQADSLAAKVAESANVGAKANIPDGFSMEAISARAAGAFAEDAFSLCCPVLQCACADLCRAISAMLCHAGRGFTVL